MPDTFSDEQRSKIMRAVKSKGNASTEIKLIQLFRKNKIAGWRRNVNLPGRPDFVFPAQKVVVFADGCFWHGHKCRNLKPADNAKYWKAKIERNKKRDAQVTRTLKREGWTVARIWECEIKKGKVGKLLRYLSR